MTVATNMCEACQAEVLPGDSFCQDCGVRLIALMPELEREIVVEAVPTRPWRSSFISRKISDADWQNVDNRVSKPASGRSVELSSKLIIAGAMIVIVIVACLVSSLFAAPNKIPKTDVQPVTQSNKPGQLKKVETPEQKHMPTASQLKATSQQQAVPTGVAMRDTASAAQSIQTESSLTDESKTPQAEVNSLPADNSSTGKLTADRASEMAQYNELLANFFANPELGKEANGDLENRRDTEPPTFKEWVEQGKPNF